MADIASGQSVSGQINMANLLKKTKLHPDGRIQLDPLTNEIAGPKNPTDGTFTVRKVEDGQPVVFEVPRYIGHAKGKDGTWRISFDHDFEVTNGFYVRGDCPQARFHELVKFSEKRKALNKNYDFLPELTDQERVSYLEWKEANSLATKKDKETLEKIS